MNLKPALFLHIQKTAGSSIVDLARRSYGSDNVMSHGDFYFGRPGIGLEKFVDGIGYPPGACKDVPFISGHFGYDWAKPLMDKRYSFTFLRNPIERVLSFYYFCKSRDPKEFAINALTQQVSLDEFLQMGLKVPDVQGRIWNNQAWQLADGYGNAKQHSVSCCEPDEILNLAIRHLEDFSYIGFTETFENDRDKILDALGIASPKKKIVSNANPGRPTSKDLPRSSLNLLEELTHLDWALYKEAWSRRDSYVKGLIKKWLRV